MIPLEQHGLYRTGNGFLYRLDPRIKVLSALIIVSAVFTSGTWSPLVVLAMAVVVTLCCHGNAFPLALKTLKLLRWLLLLTVLMHLLFTSGRTFLGVAWLSYDGLLTGGYICLQLFVAVIVATLLTTSTKVDELVSVFGWSVRPLFWLGCKTDEWQQTLALAIKMLPDVYQEIERTGRNHKASGDSGWNSWVARLQQLLVNLLNFGDRIAHQLVVEKKSQDRISALPPLFPLSSIEMFFLGTLMTLLAFCWAVV